MGDEILEINGVPIVDQDQREVCMYEHWCIYIQCNNYSSINNLVWLKVLYRHVIPVFSPEFSCNVLEGVFLASLGRSYQSLLAPPSSRLKGIIP